MLDGFEKETAPLTEYEETTLLPVMVRCLSLKRGAKNAVKNGFICSRLKDAGYSVNEARIRKLINHIRVHGLVPRLIATGAGYYVSDDQEELERYIASLRGRENAIRSVREAILSQVGL